MCNWVYVEERKPFLGKDLLPRAGRGGGESGHYKTSARNCLSGYIVPYSYPMALKALTPSNLPSQ